MADIGVRVNLEGAEKAQQGLQAVEKSIEEISAAAKKLGIDVEAYGKSIEKITTSSKAYNDLLGATLNQEISSVESRNKLNAATKGLGDEVKGLGEKLPSAVKGFGDLGEALGKIALKQTGFSATKKDISDVGEALEGVGGISGRAALGIAAVGAAAAVAGYMLVSRLSEGIDTVRMLGDHLNNLSQRTGIAVEKLSGGLRLAAETTGLSIDSLAIGMNMLNRAISEAADGTGKQAEAFKRLGIEVVDSSGKLKSADRVLEEIANAFAGAEDGAVKTEIAMTLLGRAGTNLIPLLNQGADGLSKLEREAKLAGITMDRETAEAASKLNENMRVLKAYGEGFWISVASPIVEGLAKITGAMRDARREGEGWLASLGAGIGKSLNIMGLSTPGMSAEDQRDIAVMQIQDRLKLLAAQRAQPGGGDPGMIRSLTEQISRFEAERDRLNAVLAINNPVGAYADIVTGKTTLPPPTPKPKPDKGQTNSQIVSEYLSYYNQMVQAGEMTRDEQLALLDEMKIEFKDYEDERVKIADAAAQIRKKISEDETKFAEAAAKAELTIEELAAKDVADAWKWVRFYQKKDIENLQKISDAAAKAEIKQINETTYLFKEHKMAALEELEQKYLKLEDAGADGLKRVRGEMKALEGTTRATGVVVQDVGFDMGRMWQGVHTGLTQAIGDVARYALGISSNIKSLGDALKGFFLSIVNSIIDMFAKIAANKVFEALFAGGGAAAGAGVSGSLASGAASGAASSLLGGGGGGLLNFASSALGDFSMIGSSNAGLLGSMFGPGFVGDLPLAEGLLSGGGLLEGASSFMSGLGPWGIGAGLLLGSGILGDLFGGGGGPKTQQFGLIHAPWEPSGFGFGQNNYLQGVDDMWRNANNALLNSGVYDPSKLSPYAADSGGQSLAAAVGGPIESMAAMLQRMEPARVKPFPSDWWAQWQAQFHAMGYAMGTDMVVSRPTIFAAGETGTERVTVSPIGAAHRGGGGGMTINVTGFSLMDNYAARRLAYELRRVQSG